MVKAAIVCGLCCWYPANAQQYGFLNFTTDNGLAQSQVTGMCQDNFGYLWFSTYGGVSRFDGTEFSNYTTTNGLFNNQVHSIFKDEKGRIWFGCMGGYSVFDNGAFTSYSFKEELSQSNIVAFKEKPAGSYWILFDNNSLVNVRGGKSTTYTNNDTSITESRSMTLGNDNALYIATSKGVVKFDLASKEFSHEKAFGEINCSDIVLNNDRFAVATYGDGIFIYNSRKKMLRQLTTKNKLVVDAVRHLFYDRENNLWASSINGVSLIDDSFNITNFTTDNGLSYNNIRFTAQDNEGNIWFGTNGKGILKFTGKSVLNYPIIVMSILQESNGMYWFATYSDGVYSFKDGVFTRYDDEKGLANNIVWSLAQTPDKRIWMGTSQGLSVYDPVTGKIKSYYTTDGLLADKITSLYVDRGGKLWIGSRHGLNSFYDNKFESYDQQLGITGGNIRCIVPDKKGHLWLAGSAGLFRFDGKKAQLYKYNPKIEDNTVYCLRFDDHDNLWVGTQEGLYLFKDNTFNIVGNNISEISGNVNFIMDDKEKMWFGTNNGIFELNLKDYYDRDTTIVRSYGRNEGLNGRETNLNAVYKDRANNLWFGTDGGLVKIGKKRFQVDSKSLPFVHIDNVEIFFEKPDWKKITKDSLNDFGFPAYARVRYNQNHFTFYFTGISHTQPQKIKYRFMLEGFDADWLPVTETRYVTYSNLPPGSYKFKVMAQNANGLWSREPASFEFFIIAPYWKTWWFYSLCAFAFVLILIGLWRLRLSQIKRKNLTMQLYYKSKLLSLEQQSLNASMNRHFIFNSLNSIQYYINKQDKLEANRYLTNFAKLIRKNLDSSISSDLIPLAEELDRIKLYLSLETMRFKDRFEYQVNINENIDPESIMIPPMLFQPYIENSIWHGILPKEEMGVIIISIYPNPADAALVNIEIVDDGIGLSTSLNAKIDTGSTHISRGIEITSGRLSLLKKMTNQNLEIIGPMDITDPSGKITGTLVKLVISVKIPVKDEKSEDNLYEK